MNFSEHTIEQLARTIHAAYLTKTPAPDIASHPSAVPWDALSDEFKNSNRAQARDIGEKLEALGLAVDSGDSPHPTVERFDEAITLLLARHEHRRWMREKLANGWTYAPVRDNGKRHHPMLVPYDDLPPDEQQKDINVVNNIIPLLKKIGLRVYRP